MPGDDERDFLAYASNRQDALRRTGGSADTRLLVRQALSRLTARQRAVLVLASTTTCRWSRPRRRWAAPPEQ